MREAGGGAEGGVVEAEDERVAARVRRGSAPGRVDAEGGEDLGAADGDGGDEAVEEEAVGTGEGVGMLLGGEGGVEGGGGGRDDERLGVVEAEDPNDDAGDAALGVEGGGAAEARRGGGVPGAAGEAVGSALGLAGMDAQRRTARSPVSSRERGSRQGPLRATISASPSRAPSRPWATIRRAWGALPSGAAWGRAVGVDDVLGGQDPHVAEAVAGDEGAAAPAHEDPDLGARRQRDGGALRRCPGGVVPGGGAGAGDARGLEGVEEGAGGGGCG